MVVHSKPGCLTLQNLDDESTGALNGGAPPVIDSSAKYDNINERRDGHHGNDLDSSNQPPPANISRGESFVSPAMYV